MKILLINKFFYLRGGTERHLFALMKLLEDHGHEVIHFSMKDEQNNFSKFEKYFIDEVNVEKFSIKNILKIFYNRQAVNNLEELIKVEKPDVAHLHNVATQLSPAIFKILKKYKIPIVMTLHDYKIFCPNYRFFTKDKACFKCKGGKFYNCTLNKCIKDSWSKSLLGSFEAYWSKALNSQEKIDSFIAPSKYMQDISIDFGIASEKINLIYNPLELSQDESPRGGEYLLFFGRISKEKGIETLIEAMAGLEEKLKIVGKGPDYKETELKIKSLNLTDKIDLLGPKYGDELWELIKNAKAVVIPSVWPENMPYSLLETLALGKPVIAARIGGMPEVIVDGENGFLFEPANVNDLALKIRQLSRLNIAEISEKAKASVREEKFSLEHYYKQLKKIYKINE